MKAKRYQANIPLARMLLACKRTQQIDKKLKKNNTKIFIPNKKKKKETKKKSRMLELISERLIYIVGKAV